ncbi:probable RNA-directed DNA polymerase from transposon X-element [Trichonephila clavipes]|nr:probable RNA-directed DNA polymerase from transposon X-element [Trichonephila clavipes]
MKQDLEKAENAYLSSFTSKKSKTLPGATAAAHGDPNGKNDYQKKGEFNINLRFCEAECSLLELDKQLVTSCILFEENSDKGVWVIDTAATSHFCNDKSLFLDLKPITNMKMSLATEDKSCPVEGIGTLRFRNDNDILIPQQHGFRAGLSASHQLLRVVEYIKTGFRDRKSTGAVFLDIQKAFDRVCHVGLLYKLIKINTPPHLIKLISSFLTNRSFAVKVNNIHSTNRKINAGTPLGSSISPILFNIYVNDIPRTSQSTICMFADDTAILAQSNELQLVTHFLHKHIAKLEDWFSTWKIALNVAKTEAVFFSHHIKKEPPKLYLHNTHVPWSKSTKYLGVILDKRLTFKQHIIQIRRKFNISVAKVFPLRLFSVNVKG